MRNQVNTYLAQLTGGLDYIRPTNTITAPVNGQRWSNSVFTVAGKAIDNVAVSNVLVSLNGGAWTPALLADNGSNWTEQVSLQPGTNLVAACAVDTSGNLSLTNTVKLVYVVSAPLTVQIVGSGSVSPNYNGQLLAIGNNYALKAAASNGFAFYYWGGGVPMSVNPALTFIMASNLTIIANFKDVARPTNAITFPLANEKWSNSVITVTGKAGDNVGVVGVGVQINNGGWVPATMGNGNTNWSAADLPVTFGTNIIQAYAMDAAGNVSATNETKFLGVLAPASLAGYEALLKPNGSKTNLIMTWGDGTWAQAGLASDTNANDYAAGTNDYLPTGLATAVLTNMDIGMFSALGVTNVTTVNLTFTSANGASYAWTNENDSGTGTMTITPISNLVPASLAGKTVQIYQYTTLATTIALASDGTFTSTNGFNGIWQPFWDLYFYPIQSHCRHPAIQFQRYGKCRGRTILGVDLHLRHHRSEFGELLYQPDLRQQPRSWRGWHGE